MEFVYVVRRRELFASHCPQGFERLPAEALDARYLATIREAGFFVERRHAELDSSLKQIIPYCVVLDAAAREEDAVALRLRRLGKQGERRLHDKLSIGIGGHLNPVDAPVDSQQSVLDRGVLRELGEELEVRFAGSPASPVPLGVLNDDSSPVGSVHFGIVFGLAASRETSIREKEHMTGEWAPWRSLCEEVSAGANYETWSSILLRALGPEELRAARAHSRTRTPQAAL